MVCTRLTACQALVFAKCIPFPSEGGLLQRMLFAECGAHTWWSFGRFAM